MNLPSTFTYNGMLKTNEIAGEGNSFQTEFRQYDSRLGKWLSLDPLMEQFPWMSPFVGFDNNPILYVDPYGLESSTEGDDDKNKDETKPTKKIVRPSDRKKQEEPRENDGMDGKAQEFVPDGAPANPSDGDKVPVTPNNSSNVNFYEYDGERKVWEGVLNTARVNTKKSNNAYQGWKADYTYGQNWGQVSGREISYNQNALVQQYTNFGNKVIFGGAVSIVAVPVIAYSIMTAPAWAPYALKVSTHPFIAATGRYGATSKILAYYQIGNFIGDASYQIMNVTVNKEKWNYGSSIGNLYLSNPFTSAIPGALNNLYYKPNDYSGVLGSYTLDVGGNFIGDAFMNSKFLKPGAKLGLGGFTIPMMWNLNPVLNK